MNNGGMNQFSLGGPVGGNTPMMMNGMPGQQQQVQLQRQQQVQAQQQHAAQQQAAQQQAQAQAQAQAQHQQQQQQQQQSPGNPEMSKMQLNTYIYEYFLYNQMWDCARALVSSDQPLNLNKSSPGQMGGSDDADNKDGMSDMDRPKDLPVPNLPRECPESCFLSEWWGLFWDMFHAQRGKSEQPNVRKYQEYTQDQARQRQSQQQNMLMRMSQGMMRGQQNGMAGMGPNDLARKAMQNNGRNLTPQQQMQLSLAKQQQMQRDGSGMDENRRPNSPQIGGEGAPSPSKRPRIDNGQFNAQPGMMPTGRGQPIPGQQQFQNFPGGQAPGGPNKALMQYNNTLAQHQQKQMPGQNVGNPNGPTNQGSPMMGGDGMQPTFFANGGEMQGNANGARPNQNQVPPPGQQNTGSHALQDYQMQLMLLEQQNKKRLLMARQEQETGIPADPQGPVLAPSIHPVIYNTSPQNPGPRSINSPNPGDLKRNTPGVPSPENAQSRGSPANMQFMPGQMEGNMNQQFFKQNGPMDGVNNMVPPNMRPPSSHPQGMPFSGQNMTQQQMVGMQRQQAAQAAQQQQQNVGQLPGWPNGGPGQAPMMQQQGSQQGQQPTMGTPRQGAMPPPNAPGVAGAVNGRTQPSSPQVPPAPPTPSQTKGTVKTKKETKPKRTTKKAAATTGATPADTSNTAAEPATPTPQTPITPMHPKSFTSGAPNAATITANASANASAVAQNVAPPPQPQPDANAGFDPGFDMMSGLGMDFAGPNMNGDVLQDFDFDSFLNNDADPGGAFEFDQGFALGGEEVES